MRFSFFWFNVSAVAASCLVLFGSGVARAQYAGIEDVNSFRTWLEQDVGFLLTKEEKDNSRGVVTAMGAQLFVELFWQRRDPTPDTIRNEFREEHYRRMLSADQSYSTPGKPGWKTDRGRIYIFRGPPDTVQRCEVHSDCESLGRFTERAVERWHYTDLPGLGPTTVEFVDRDGDGDLRLVMSPDDPNLNLAYLWPPQCKTLRPRDAAPGTAMPFLQTSAVPVTSASWLVSMEAKGDYLLSDDNAAGERLILRGEVVSRAGPIVRVLEEPLDQSSLILGSEDKVVSLDWEGSIDLRPGSYLINLQLWQGRDCLIESYRTEVALTTPPG